MPLNLDSYLGVPAQALALTARRTEVLASNLANVDTPNYKARDFDFKTAMAAASGGAAATPALTPTGTATPGAARLPIAGNEAAAANTGGAQLQYRVPTAPALDGNTVDEQLEQSAFAQNSVRYQATLTIINTRLRELMTAITGS